jgi:hypothetical protein
MPPAPGEPAVEDEKWIEHVGRNGWIALSVNPHMCRSQSQLAAIREFNARVFSLGTTQAVFEMKVFLFGRWWRPLVTRSHKPEPCLWRLYVDRIIKTIK